MSTFIVETDESSWARAGFATMGPDETKACFEAVFRDTLDGQEEQVDLAQFSEGKERALVGREQVLVGDALHTAHFSIGSGTRLAMEDAIAFAEALDRHPQDIPAALASYEAARRPVVEKLVAAADRSAAWYERFGEHMRLDPMAFAMGYITRSGRVDPERLRRISPGFMSAYEAAGSTDRG